MQIVTVALPDDADLDRSFAGAPDCCLYVLEANIHPTEFDKEKNIDAMFKGIALSLKGGMSRLADDHGLKVYRGRRKAPAVQSEKEMSNV